MRKEHSFKAREIDPLHGRLETQTHLDRRDDKLLFLQNTLTPHFGFIHKKDDRILELQDHFMIIFMNNQTQRGDFRQFT